MKKLFSITFILLFSLVTLTTLAKEAKATRAQGRAEAITACQNQGRTGKALSDCIRQKMTIFNEVSQSEEEVDNPTDEEGTTEEGSY